uniref:DUF190 domain-containing protein n=1 Tax=Caldimicrobium thiodismutans TaxID=1653476 RepID=A0A832LWN2_9BACT
MEVFDQKGLILRIYVREDDRIEGKLLYKKIIEMAKAENIAGVTVFRAIMGYGPSRKIRTLSFADLSSNLPVMLEIVDTEENIKNFLSKINGLIKHGLITLQPIIIVKNLP